VTVAQTLLPVPVLLPLAVATALLALSHWLPTAVANVLGIITALTVMLLCGYLAREALDGNVLQWFGGWTPASSQRPGVVLGISFLADPASAAVAAYAGLMFAAALLFAFGYAETRSHFQILMLLFLAAMVGFCLTHDLFNMFVWFELMSVAAFALTAYPLGKSSLEGAFNFTITNALGSFMMLAGVGLLYARTGTLDFTQMGRVVTASGADAVISAGFCLVAAALLTKAAIVPFHMWLSDAHAVAPSPVSVIFSGIMVSVALFALGKIVAQVFIHDDAVMMLVRTLCVWLGAATALVGGLMAWAQRHLKRLLAFSTIAHLGIMLIGIAAVAPTAMSGFVLYLFGHGLVKGSLFMIAGILLSLRASGDEIVLYRKARDLWPAGVAMAIGALLLGGLPFGLLHHATDTIDPSGRPLITSAVVISTALTGAAVLRAAARIFAGWSGTPGPEITAPTERDHEKDDRPFWLMLSSCALLLLIAFTPGAAVESFLSHATVRLMNLQTPIPPPHEQEPSALVSYLPIALTLGLFVISLFRQRATAAFSRRLFGAELKPLRALQFIHSGIVSDYIAWMMLGLAALALVIGR
jgi:multicomponent Na+:H+ antiporter subunit D